MGLESEVKMRETRTERAIRADNLVQKIIEDHPQTVLIFARHGLQCAGCYISPYHTVADSAREYGIPLDPLLQDLNGVTATGKP
jgi:hybrid cluster-associated redox disulfide protein